MAGSAAGSAAKYVFRPLVDEITGAEEHGGIQIALDSALPTDPRPALVERDAPVQRDEGRNPRPCRAAAG